MVNVYIPAAQAEASSPYGGGTQPTTAAQADAGNTIGRENRADKGLSGYGGRTSEQLNQINQQTEQERQQKSQQEQDRLNYEQRARVNAGNRPGYTDPSELGDTTTQNFLRMRRVLGAVGQPMPDEDVFLGGVLEGQRKIAVTTPGTRDDQFFTNELTKWNHNPIELSSAYHDVGMNAGAPIPANPFENRGDVALAFEKGGNQRDFTVDRYGFNPNVGNMINTLPNGQGLQETSWTVAKTGQPANVDFQPAIDYQVSQKGKYGPYGYLEGGIVDKVDVSVPTVREPAGTAFNGLTVTGASVPGKGIGVLDKDWNPFVASAAEPTGYISEGIQIPSSTNETSKVGGKHYLISATTSKWIGGAIGSSVDFVTGIVGWTPFKDRMQTIDPKLESFRIENEKMKATATPEEYNQFLQKSFEEGTLTKPITSPTFVENPRLTYDYGEFSKWGAGAGDVVRGRLGFTQEQLDASQYNIEQKKGIETIPEKLVFGTGYTISTHPEKVISAYGGGALMVAGGEIVGAGAGATGITARLSATAAAHPTAAAITTNVVRFGVPTVLAGATYYGASEQLTATPERTTVNLGKMIPEAVGVAYGGASAYAGTRLVERYGIPRMGPFISGQISELKPPIQTLDLRGQLETINLDTMSRSGFQRPENVATPAEQAMIMRQYQLTPQEIRMAKMQGLSVNDILGIRELEMQYAKPAVSEVTPIQIYDVRQLLSEEPMILSSLRMESMQSIDMQSVQATETKQINLFGTQQIIGNNIVNTMIQSPKRITYQDTTANTIQKPIQDSLVVPFVMQTSRQIPTQIIPPITKSIVSVPDKPWVPPITKPIIPVPDRPWVPTDTPQKPPVFPKTPIIPPFVVPWFPDTGGGGYGKKRRGRKFTEYFPMGILAGVQAGYGLKTPKLARPKKGRVIPKSMLSPVKRKKK